MIILYADIDPQVRIFHGFLLGIIISIILYFYKRNLTKEFRPRKKSLFKDLYDRASENLGFSERYEYKVEKLVEAKYHNFFDVIQKYAPKAEPYFLELDLVQFKEKLDNGLGVFGFIEYTIIDSYILKRNSIGAYKESKFGIEIKATISPNVKLKATSGYFYDTNQIETEFKDVRKRLFENRKFKDALQLNRIK